MCERLNLQHTHVYKINFKKERKIKIIRSQSKYDSIQVVLPPEKSIIIPSNVQNNTKLFNVY